MIGRNPGRITTQGGILTDLFKAADYPVLSVSDSPNRWVRFAEIVTTLVRQRRRIDLVVLEIYGRQSFVVEDAASWLARRFGLPLVMVLHSGCLPSFTAKFPSWSRRVFERADRLVAPSPFLARTAGRMGFDVGVIPNVVDLRLLPYRFRACVRPRLLWMRSFYSHYNPLMAIAVAGRLRQTFDDTSLVMAGPDKGIQSDVERAARVSGLGDCVRFPGFLDASAKVREAEAADIFINTNQIDNTPVAVIEACSMGLPVVATDVGGIGDLLVDGETGLIVPDGDAAAMAAAVDRLVRDPRLAARLSANGRALAEQSSWVTVRTRWEQLFADVTRTASAPHLVASPTT